MESNGHGSFIQTIYFSVPKSDADAIEARGFAERLGETSDPERSNFVWHRSTIRTGRDDEIAFELDVMIGMLPLCDWKIDWAKTEY